MKYLFTTGLIILFILGAKAQSDFRDGYIIHNNNDTVNGFINYKGNKANAKKCIFREDMQSENQTFTPDEIKGYRFTDSKYYVSKIVNEGNKKEQVFLEYLIDGIVDIYYYRDEQGDHYFVDDGNDNLLELTTERKEVIVNNTRYINENKRYIGLLKSVFKDSPSIYQKVDNVDLNHKSLVTIAHDYHNEICIDEECIIYEKKIPKIKNAYGLIIGLNIMSFIEIYDFPAELYYLRNNDFGYKILPSIGVYYKMNIPYINERLYIQYEGTYSRMRLTTNSSIIEPIYSWTIINDITLIQNVFNNVCLVKYEFPNGKIKPTMHIGGFAGYYFKTDYERNREVIFAWGDTKSKDQINDSPFEKFDYGINCGAGLKIHYKNDKELFLDLRYQRGFGLLKQFNTNTFLMNLGFQIGK